MRRPKRDAEPEEVIAAMLNRYSEFALGQAQPAPDPRLEILIDAIRWVRTELSRPPMRARRRFFVLVQAHQMNAEAANALLKSLEEPQVQSTFILTTSRPGLLPATIRSRCQQVRFRRLAPEVIRQWLQQNAQAIPAQAELATALAEGSLGTALRVIEDPESFLVQPVVRYFTGELGASERAVLATLEAAKEVPPASMVGTLLFLYRQAFALKVGLDSPYAAQNPGIIEAVASRNLDYLRRALRFLLARSIEASTNVNARLFNYTLLTTLKPPPASTQARPAPARPGPGPTR